MFVRASLPHNADQPKKLYVGNNTASQVLKTQSKMVSLLRLLLWKADHMAKFEWREHSKMCCQAAISRQQTKKKNKKTALETLEAGERVFAGQIEGSRQPKHWKQ